jgi:hypothetical protein
VLPDWFDLHVLRLTVAAATVATGLGAVLWLALARQVALRAAGSLVLAAMTIALVFYAQGPLKDCEQTCDCRFLKSDIAVDGCATVTTQSARGAQS